MCGIYGVVALQDGVELNPEWLHRMGQAIAHRGPDGEGSYADARALIGMRRLAIIDVPRGQQPIANETRTVHAVCNGEIFNYRELRQKLVAAGHRFRSGTDSEVLVHLYEDEGAALLHKLDGMYAFGIWEPAKRRLLLGRDRLGIKPLYYWHDDKRFAFASEVKALLELPFVSAQLDPNAVRGLLTFGYVPGAQSIFAGIKRLPHASMLSLEGSQPRVVALLDIAARNRHDAERRPLGRCRARTNGIRGRCANDERRADRCFFERRHRLEQHRRAHGEA